MMKVLAQAARALAATHAAALRFQERFWRTPGACYEPGPADDLYALGVTAYRLVTGGYPPPWVPAQLRERDPSYATLASEPPEKWVTVSLELAAIIRQLVSEEPAARGSATHVAEALEAAATSAGSEADQPVTPRATAASGVRKSRPVPSRPARARWRWLGAATGLAATVGLITVLSFHGQPGSQRHVPPQPLEELTRPEREAGREDAGASLAQETLMSARVEQPEMAGWGLRVEVPKKPLPGQAKPPCKQRGAAVINGGCWGRPEVSTPPCREGEYEWEGLCYHPILGPTPPATSEQR